MPTSGTVVRCGAAAFLSLLAGLSLGFGTKPVTTEVPSRVVTNIGQLESLVSTAPVASHPILLEGNVWWASRVEDRFVLQDDSGTAEIEMELQGRRPRAGERVRLKGNGTITRHGTCIRLGVKGPVVDNDGEHSMSEKSGGVHLRQGLNPIRLEWFNGMDDSGLKVGYEGPDLPRQRIPSSVLFQVPSDHGTGAPGLGYQCYTGVWQTLPDFEGCPPTRTGVASNFDLSVLPRPQNVALVFEGELQVAQSGFYVFHLASDDGSRVFVGTPSLSIETIGDGRMPEPRLFALGQTWTGPSAGAWGVLEGHIAHLRQVDGRTLFDLCAGSARVRVELGDASGQPRFFRVDCRVRVTGFCQPAITPQGDRVVGAILVPDFGHIRPMDPLFAEGSSRTNAVGGSEYPMLTTSAQVHRLRRDEADRGYPVSLRGVVTCVLPEHQAFTLQDSTRGLYVEDHSLYRSRAPQVGEFLRVEGVTDPSLFAPIVKATIVSSLGIGRMPEPVKPTWDQLMNGSLDAQFVEMEGIVTAVQPGGISLLTRDGLINVELRVPGWEDGALGVFENALVRIRGCLFASWDYVTHQVQMGEIRIYGADVTIEEPPPEDLFGTPAKTVDELLQFDPQAGAFQRVKVAGQVVGARGADHFLMQGNNGLRCLLMDSNRFSAGDLVEVVGFPELFGSASPMLREAVARKMGRAPLPAPAVLSADDLGSAVHDSTLVQLEGLLVGIRRDASGLILEMQNGVRTFMARVDSWDDSLRQLPTETRLQLRGVYASHGGTRSRDGEITGFDLLVKDAGDIAVLARPPWWTLKHLLIIVCLLGCGLAATMLWITQLRRQVEQRSAELAMQIKERQHLEYERALEQERARIARDLHDELGSGITEISMLASRAKGAIASGERGRRYLDEAWTKAREMVTSLDEIVWAMDPHHDSVSSLVSYFSLYADRFLGLAGVVWRLEGSEDVPDRVVDSHHRHQLFLVFKEALNNVVRHAGATEVGVRIQVKTHEIVLTVRDNGRGLPPGEPGDTLSGLNNMKARVEKLGGHLELSSQHGAGTTLRVFLPSNQNS